MKVFCKVSGLQADKTLDLNVDLIHDKENKFSNFATDVVYKGNRIGKLPEKLDMIIQKDIIIDNVAKLVRSQNIKSAKIASVTLEIEYEDTNYQKEIKTPTNEDTKATDTYCQRCGGETFLSKKGNRVCKIFCWKKKEYNKEEVENKLEEDNIKLETHTPSISYSDGKVETNWI